MGLFGLLGCDSEKPTKPLMPSAHPPTSVTLRIAVAEDTALTEAIKRLRGEWSERSGGELVVETVSQKEILSGEFASQEFQQPPDLLIFASRHLGELCEAGRLRPMRKSVLKDEDLSVSDFFPQVRERLMVFGGETMALPVGCVAPALAISNGAEPGKPATLWRDLDDGIVWRDPSGGWLPKSHALLGLVACYSSRTAALFDPETMAPRLTDSPSLRSMKRVVQQGKRFALRPKLVGGRTLGKSQVAVVGPRRQPNDILRFDKAVVSRLPGVNEVYSPIADEWEPVVGDPRRVPLLATSGRLIGVTTESRNAASAFRLAAWLVGVQNARQLSIASPNVANPRKSLAGVADDWTGRGDKELGKQFAAANAASLSGRHALLIPRIIRIDDYLAALSEQVERAIAGEATAEQALSAAADDWERLTDEVGRDRQSRCYQAHLQGLGE